MTKRLTLAGIAAVAALWGPYVYAELARRPLKPPADESALVEAQPVVVPTPVAYQPSPRPEPAEEEWGHTTLGTSIDPELAPSEPLVELPAEPELAEHELGEPPVDPTLAPPSAAEAAEPPAGPSAALAQAAVDDLPAQPPPAAPAQAAADDPAAQPPSAAPAQAAPAQAAADDPAAQPPSAAEPGAAAEAPAAPSEPAESAAEATEPARETTENAEAAEQSAHAKAVREGKLNVIPDAIAPAFRNAFDKESRDVTWAAKEESSLSSFLSNAGVPPRAVSELRCQRTVCRVSIDVTLLPATAQSELYERARERFGAGLALDPTSKDQGAAFYVMRRPR